MLRQCHNMTPKQCCLRARRLQRLCSKLKLDGILLILGLDGRYNPGSHVALAFLLEGRSNRDLLDVTQIPSLIEDIVLLIKPSTVSVYSPNSEAKNYISPFFQPYFSTVTYFTPSSTEASDPDLAEEFKLAAFVHMLSGAKDLGIALPSDFSSESGNSLIYTSPPRQISGSELVYLETWPLLQAYGLEGVGRPGFFTMNFKVWDIGSSLQPIHAALDGQSVCAWKQEAAAALKQHWQEAVRVITQCPEGERGCLTEVAVAEPLASYYAYGEVRQAPGVAQGAVLPPKVAFGSRTSNTNTPTDATITMQATANTPHGSCLHLVMHAADSRSPLRAVRSILLAQGAVASDVLADPNEDEMDSNRLQAAVATYRPDDVIYLAKLYTILVNACQSAIDHFCTQDKADVQSSYEAALASVLESCHKDGINCPVQQKLRCHMWQSDHANNVTIPAVKGSRQLKVLHLVLADIHSPHNPATLLGSLAYADTFLDIPADPASNCAAAAVNLTETIPAFITVPCLGAEAIAQQRLRNSLAQAVTVLGSTVIGSSAHEGAAAVRISTAAAAAARRQKEREAAIATAAVEAAASSRRQLGLADNIAAVPDDDQADEEDSDSVAQLAGSDMASAVSGIMSATNMLAVHDVTTSGVSAEAAQAQSTVQGVHGLGRLLTIGPADECIVLTDCYAAAAVPTSLYCFQYGLVVLCQLSQTVWVIDLRTDVACVTVTELKHEDGSSLGEAVLLQGHAPACGWPPVCHVSNNSHLALSLASMNSDARRHMLVNVLPAWQQTCRELAPVGSNDADATIRYVKRPSMVSPFSPSVLGKHTSAVWPAATQDNLDTQLMERLDKLEITGELSGLDPSVEQLLAPKSVTAGSHPITLVAGLPGCEQTLVTSCISTLMGTDVPHTTVMLPCSGQPQLEHADIRQAVSKLSQDAGQPQQLILATSCFHGILAQLGMIADAAAAEGKACHVAAVIVCVSSSMLYEEPSRQSLLPGIAEQLQAGFVDLVVVACSSSEYGQMQHFVQRHCPGVNTVRASRSYLLTSRQLLLPPSHERATLKQEAAALRHWAPGGPLTPPRLQCGQLQSVQLIFEGAIDVDLLRPCLEQRGLTSAVLGEQARKLPLSEQAREQQLVAVTGVLAPEASAGCPSSVLASRTCSLRCLELSTPLEHAYPGITIHRPGGALEFWGTQLDTQLLQQLLTSCTHGANPTTAHMQHTAEAVTREEHAQIRQAHLFDPLPEGYFFDGAYYIDPFGDKTHDHPDMHLFIAQHVDELNASLLTAQKQSEAAASTLRFITVTSKPA